MSQLKIRKLQEEIGAVKKEIRTYLDANQNIKSDDAKLKELEARFDSVNSQIEIETRQLARESAAPRELSISEQRDSQRFHLGKALQGTLTGKLDGVEKELHDEGIREARDAGIKNNGGLMLPSFFVRRQNRLEQRAMTATGTTSTSLDQGGQTIATTPEGLVDSFYEAMVLEKAGFTIIEGLVGNVPFPRYVKDTNPPVKAENATATALAPTTATITLTPHRLPAYTDISEQLLMQSSAAIETVVRRNIAEQMAAQMQNLVINGTGSSNQPTGILNTAGIGALYAGGANTTSSTYANGSAQVWSDWVNLETYVANQNVTGGRLGYLTNAKVRGQAKQTLKGLKTIGGTTATDSRMIWDAGDEVNGYNAYVTNSVYSTGTKGTGTGLSSLIHGRFDDGYVGMWAGLSLELLRDGTLATQGFYRLVGALYFDFGIVRPVSFAAIQDISA